MSKVLKTISINFPFKNTSVVCHPDFCIQQALFDFEVAVVRPYAIRPPTPDRPGPSRVQFDRYTEVKEEIGGRNEDIMRLLGEGGLLIVVLDVIEILECHTEGQLGGTLYTATNYDFLHNRFVECIKNGSGEKVTCDPSDPFSDVIKNSGIHWTAFLLGRIRMPLPFNRPVVFATNSAETYVGASVAVGPGHVVFLPNFKQLNEELFFEACVEYRERKQGTPAPDWVASCYLPGQAELEQEIESLDEEITALETDREQKLTALDELLGYKNLLFEKGKTRLEPVVVKAFNALGFQASPAEAIPRTKFEIDGRTKAGSVPGILEVKGSKKQIGLDEFAPFTTKILADFQATNVHSKGILIGNGQCLEKPEKRLGKSVFSPHVLDAAKRNSISLVNSVELYAVLCNVLDGLITDLEQLREQILTTNGYSDLQPFINNKSPFATK